MKIRMFVSGKKAVILLLSLILAGAVLIGGIVVRATVAASSSGVPVPILMYHSVGYNSKVHSKYLISPEAFEEDLIWIRDHGYETVLISDLISYVEEGKSLPKKPVVITLDDGYLNNLTYVFPLLEKYDMKAVISVVGIYCEQFSSTPDPNPAYAHLTWSDVASLSASGRVEIGNHTYNMHSLSDRRGCMKRTGETVEVYRTTLRDDLQHLQDVLSEQSGVLPEVFTYPYGAVSKEALSVIQDMGFRAAMTCNEQVNLLSPQEPEQLFRLGRFNRASGIETDAFMKRVLGR